MSIPGRAHGVGVHHPPHSDRASPQRESDYPGGGRPDDRVTGGTWNQCGSGGYARARRDHGGRTRGGPGVVPGPAQGERYRGLHYETAIRRIRGTARLRTMTRFTDDIPPGGYDGTATTRRRRRLSGSRRVGDAGGRRPEDDEGGFGGQEGWDPGSARPAVRPDGNGQFWRCQDEYGQHCQSPGLRRSAHVERGSGPGSPRHTR